MDNPNQLSLPGMEDSDELTNPLTTSTKEFVRTLVVDGETSSELVRSRCTLLLTCARTIDRLCRKGRDISRMVTSYNETLDKLQPQDTAVDTGRLSKLLKDMAQ